jgi:hypothetical protein
VAPGVLHIAVPYDERIELDVGGVQIPGRPGFGVTTAFDLDETGAGVLSYEQDPSRSWWRAAQIALWLAVLVVAAGARSPFGRRRMAEVQDETLIDLSESPSGVIAGEALGAPGWDGAEPEWVSDPEPEWVSDPEPEWVFGPASQADDVDAPVVDPVVSTVGTATPSTAAPAGPHHDVDGPSGDVRHVTHAVDDDDDDDDDEVDLAALVAQVDDTDADDGDRS